MTVMVMRWMGALRTVVGAKHLPPITLAPISMARASPLRGQAGISMVEVVLAMAIMSSVAVAGLGALSTAARATQFLDGHAVARELARAQLEYVRSLPYEELNENDEAVYDTIDLEGHGVDPDVYEISAIGTGIPDPNDPGELRDGLQLITVTVSRSGQDVMTIEGYKNEQ